MKSDRCGKPRSPLLHRRGSDARIIMGDDEAALLRLWREKRGEVEPEDLRRQSYRPARGRDRGSQSTLVRRAGDRGAKAIPRPSPPLLDPDASAALRDQLAAELNGIGSAEEATTWAYRVLGPKSSLTPADAKGIEDAFQVKLDTLASANDVAHALPVPPDEPPRPAPSTRKRRPRGQPPKNSAESIDKGDLAHPEPRRVRDRDHVRFVAKQACVICGRTPSDPHHLRFAQHQSARPQGQR